MSSLPQYEKEANEKELAAAESLPHAALVREQLRRILAHPLFTNSKRYPVLLAYTVDQTLAGNAGDLKERTIGVEAFGREPNYDVNLDPVVRITAAEVRKRLVQYYYNPDHAGELVIELPVGSYVPSFRDSAAPHTLPAPQPLLARKSQPSSAESITPRDASPAFAPRHWVPIAIALLFAGFLGFSLGHGKLPTQRSNLQRFWEPISTTSNTITYCVGDSGVDHQPDRGDGDPAGKLNLSDVITLARSIGPLVLGKSTFRVVSAPDIGFAQLREGPIVLIGAFNNPWTLRITQDLPIGFERLQTEHDSKFGRIVDHKNPQERFWNSQWRVPKTDLAQDYAIVARFHDNVTGQPVIILAGILAEGTEAASEVVSNPEYLNGLLEKLPKNWEKQNFEAVIQTQVIQGHPGPPTVVGVSTW